MPANAMTPNAMPPNEVTTGVLTSRDGARIAWSRQGCGPPLVMVDCVGASRATTPQPTLARSLSAHFTVTGYDRRGKGESQNTAPYAVEREFEDLAAVIALAGGPADVYGFSSGATLALLAAEAGVPIRRLALLEPPLSPEPDPGWATRTEAQRRIDADLADARHWFATHVVGVPDEVLAQMPPPGPEDLSNTRTIVHELTFLPQTPAGRFATVHVPTMLVASDHTAPEILQGVADLAEAMPEATARVLPGEWHGVDDATLTEAVRQHLLEVPARPAPAGRVG